MALFSDNFSSVHQRISRVLRFGNPRWACVLIVLILPFTVWCKPSHVEKCRAFEKAVKKAENENQFGTSLKAIKFQEPNQFTNFMCTSFGSLGGKADGFGTVTGGMSFSFSAWPKTEDAENECIKEKGGFGEKISQNLYQNAPDPYIDWHHYLSCNRNSLFHIYYSPKDFPNGPDKKLIEISRKTLGGE